MTILDLIDGELVDIVEWAETEPNELAWRFERPRSEIKNGAQLIVRPGQLAVFVEQGTIADVFQPGRHELVTKNLPVLSRLRGWKYGFESPFKADVVFVSTRQMVGCKWGTKSPVMTRDSELGPVRLRAYGTYVLRVSDGEAFVRELVGTHGTFALGQVSDQLRDLIVSRFSEVLGEAPVSVMQLASRYEELGAKTAAKVAPDAARLGLSLPQLVVESIALPDEVAASLDQRTRIGIIGDIGQYAQLQAADALRDAARNPGGGAASAGAAIGVGVALGQQLGATANAAMAHPPLPANAPPPLPTSVAYFVAENGKPAGPFGVAELRKRVTAGTLNGDTLVWKDGMPAWAAASSIDDVAALLSPR